MQNVRLFNALCLTLTLGKIVFLIPTFCVQFRKNTSKETSMLDAKLKEKKGFFGHLCSMMRINF